MNPVAARFGGVKIPEGQLDAGAQRVDLPMGTVVQLVEMRVCGVGIVDENGKIVSTVAYRLGDTWWTDPNGEVWIRSLLKAGPKLSKNFEDALRDFEALTSTSQEQPVAAKKVNTTASRLDAKVQKITGERE